MKLLLLQHSLDYPCQVVEFNVRFGDPEAQVLMNVLKDDLYLIMRQCAAGNLQNTNVRFSESLFSVGVVVASGGYPNKCDYGYRIDILPEEEVEREAGETARSRR